MRGGQGSSRSSQTLWRVRERLELLLWETLPHSKCVDKDMRRGREAPRHGGEQEHGDPGQGAHGAGMRPQEVGPCATSRRPSGLRSGEGGSRRGMRPGGSGARAKMQTGGSGMLKIPQGSPQNTAGTRSRPMRSPRGRCPRQSRSRSRSQYSEKCRCDVSLRGRKVLHSQILRLLLQCSSRCHLHPFCSPCSQVLRLRHLGRSRRTTSNQRKRWPNSQDLRLQLLWWRSRAWCHSQVLRL